MFLKQDSEGKLLPDSPPSGKDLPETPSFWDFEAE